MKMRSDLGSLDPRIEHELAVLDRALAGRPVDPGDADIAELAQLLRDERPEPEPGWTAELDERAAAGFPRGGADRGGRVSGRGGGWLVPAGALATLLLVVVVVAVNNRGGTDVGPSDSAGTATTVAPEQGAQRLDAGRAAALESSSRDRGIAPGIANRKVDRDAQLTLSARPDDVRGVSDEVISITRSLGGVVTSSQVTEGADGASASLQLTLPTRNLDAALDRMTDLADVDSLNETAIDITKPVVSAEDRLRDAEARRRELLQALGNAATEAEADALELKIAEARREIARAEASYERLVRKARLSDLAVTVNGDPGASAERTLGDWLDDAVTVLRTIAGVLLVAAAILIPLGLIAAVAALVLTRLRRRRRERVLEG